MANAAPPIECRQVHPSLFVEDVEAAARWYVETLGFRLAFTHGAPADIAGLNLGDVQIFLERGTPRAGTSVYFVVDDADALYEFHRAKGVRVLVEIGDREYGLRDYAVADAWGHRLSFGRHTFTAGEPIPIERVELTVRLEKRLVAVLEDLAKHNRVSVASALEEILCHTNDGVTPHTPQTVARIQELKRKHGVDYDTHGSYRFVERT